MKLSFCCLFLLLFFFACREGAPASVKMAISDSLAQKAMGTYLGRFGESPITVVLNYISGVTVSGYSVHKGLRRNFNGEASLQGGALDFSLREPGDNVYDGSFSFALDTTSWKIKGKWTPLNKGSERPLLLSRSAPHELSMWGEMIWVGARGIDFRDSILTFRDDGVCVFRFYERPSDSTSQVITITGNYELEDKDGYRIEWEENSHLTSVNMKMIVQREKSKEGYQMDYLCGGGLKLLRLVLP